MVRVSSSVREHTITFPSYELNDNPISHLSVLLLNIRFPNMFMGLPSGRCHGTVVHVERTTSIIFHLDVTLHRKLIVSIQENIFCLEFSTTNRYLYAYVESLSVPSSSPYITLRFVSSWVASLNVVLEPAKIYTNMISPTLGPPCCLFLLAVTSRQIVSIGTTM